MTIKVKSHEECPLRCRDDSSFVCGVFHASKMECEQQQSDSGFPDGCPLLAGSVSIERELEEEE